MGQSKRRLCAIGLFVVAAMFVAPQSASACACCASPGAWFVRQEKIGERELRDMNLLRLAGVANTYMTDAGVDALQGITDPSETYTLSHARGAGRRWTLQFKDAQGHTGALSFQIPWTATAFGVDLRDGRDAGAGGPLLYKEWRFEGPLASGTGVFKRGTRAGTKYRLVFHGRGNACTNAADFKTWTLQVFDAKSQYSFYGSLAATTADATN